MLRIGKAVIIWTTVVLMTVDPVSAGRRSAAALRAPFRVLPGAGHLSMLASPDAIARAINSFAGHRTAARLGAHNREVAVKSCVLRSGV